MGRDRENLPENTQDFARVNCPDPDLAGDFGICPDLDFAEIGGFAGEIPEIPTSSWPRSGLYREVLGRIRPDSDSDALVLRSIIGDFGV